jgi:glycosyltransferase involved in cell wall biosynthesis
MSKHENIRCINKKNGGAAEARNLGISMAQGEYIGFMDSDDYIDSDMFKCMYDKAKEKDYDVVECNLHHVYPNGKMDTEVCEKYTDNRKLLMNGRNVVWNKIYRRKWLVDTGVNFPVGYIYEDLAFYSKLVVNIRSCAYVDEAFYYYVQRNDSVNKSQNLKTLDIIPVLQDIYDYYKQIGEFENYRKELEFLYAKILLLSSFNRMCHIPNSGDRKKALDLNWKCLCSHFPDWKDNEYVAELKTKKGMFMRGMNKATYRLSGMIIPIFVNR